MQEGAGRPPEGETSRQMRTSQLERRIKRAGRPRANLAPNLLCKFGAGYWNLLQLSYALLGVFVFELFKLFHQPFALSIPAVNCTNRASVGLPVVQLGFASAN